MFNRSKLKLTSPKSFKKFKVRTQFVEPKYIYFETIILVFYIILPSCLLQPTYLNKRIYMTSLLKFRVPNVVKWVHFLCRENNFTSSKSNLYINGLHPILQQFSFCTTKMSVNSKYGGNIAELAKKSRLVRREAQAALLEYFHSTRSLRVMDAESMSENTPEFFDKLLKRVEIDDGDIGKSLTRFLRYHPINEFEPFFESIGLSPSEYSSFLPRNLMFLHDDNVLLENYYVLCEYVIARNRIGNIYKGAREIFGYDHGVLKSKLQFFENLGLKQSFIGKIITSSPYLLRGEVNLEFLEALGKLEKVGIEFDWLEKHISDKDFYNWKCILDLLSLLSEVIVREERLGELIKQHPDMLLECSGGVSVFLLVFFLKIGFTQTDIQTVFLKFPKISVVKFKNNLCQCYEFLVAVEMDIHDIGTIVCNYPILLGSCELKKVESLVKVLNCGKKRICQMIMDDPNVLKTWVLRVRVDPLPSRTEELRKSRTNFLLNLGFVLNSKEMEKALRVFKGKAVELQERFDFLVGTGLSREEAIKMVKVCPQILSRDKDVIKTKIDFFADLGYSASYLAMNPSIFGYTTERVKQRVLACQWLKDEGMYLKLALSTLLTLSEKKFVENYVYSHPGGREFWEKLKKEVYSD